MCAGGNDNRPYQRPRQVVTPIGDLRLAGLGQRRHGDIKLNIRVEENTSLDIPAVTIQLYDELWPEGVVRKN